MKVFITGATGLIGGSALRALRAAGHEVTGLTSRPSGKAAIEAAGGRALVGDMRDAAVFREVVAEADAVVHAAAAMPEKMRLSQRDVDTFLGADAEAVDVLASVLGPGCRAFVITSGAYVYGDTGDRPVDESRSTERHHPIMALKVAMERRMLERAARGEVPAILVRPGLVYGDGSLWARLYLDAMKKKKRALMPGSGEQLLSFVHHDDVGEAYRVLIENPTPGRIYNIADDLPERLGVVARAQATALGAPPPLAVPGWILRFVAGDLTALPTLANTALDSSALKALGWAPRYPTYREGIPAMTAALGQG